MGASCGAQRGLGRRSARPPATVLSSRPFLHESKLRTDGGPPIGRRSIYRPQIARQPISGGIMRASPSPACRPNQLAKALLTRVLDSCFRTRGWGQSWLWSKRRSIPKLLQPETHSMFCGRAFCTSLRFNGTVSTRGRQFIGCVHFHVGLQLESFRLLCLSLPCILPLLGSVLLLVMRQGLGQGCGLYWSSPQGLCH